MIIAICIWVYLIISGIMYKLLEVKYPKKPCEDNLNPLFAIFWFITLPIIIGIHTGSTISKYL